MGGGEGVVVAAGGAALALGGNLFDSIFSIKSRIRVVFVSV